MEHHGTIFKTRYQRLREQVLAMKELWTKDVAEFHGELRATSTRRGPGPSPRRSRTRRFSSAARAVHAAARGGLLRRLVPARPQRRGVLTGLPDLRRRAAKAGRDMKTIYDVGLRRRARRGAARHLRGGRHHRTILAAALRGPRHGPAAARSVGEADQEVVRAAPAWASAFLREARVGRLATADAAGRPLVVPVCYAFDGARCYSAVDAKPKRTRESPPPEQHRGESRPSPWWSIAGTRTGASSAG